MAAAVQGRHPFEIVVAKDEGNGIGLKGTLPWDIPREKRFFRQLTTSTSNPFNINAMVVGYRTWKSMPPVAMTARVCVVVTRSAEHAAEAVAAKCLAAPSLDAALATIEPRDDIEHVYVIGGAVLYEEALKHPLLEVVHLTRIAARYEADTFFPDLDLTVFELASKTEQIEDRGVRFHVEVYRRRPEACGAIRTAQHATALARAATSPSSASVPSLLTMPVPTNEHQEMQYLRLIADVMATGQEKDSRAGPTISKFGAMMRFDLRDSFPLLTTKRVFWKGVAEELFWFIGGNTSALTLQHKGIHIWDANASAEFLKKACPECNYEEGDLGPIYGFQWRHFGAEYTNMNADYAGKGIDQLKNVIEMIRHDPSSRRIIMSAWNPLDLEKMALPPCHVLSHFMVHDGEISCLLYQRSADLGLGVPFNIASYSLLTYLLAHVCDLKPREFVHVLGDAHVYKNHIEGLKTQLARTPKPFPKLVIKSPSKNIDEIHFADLELVGYDPHPMIKLDMNA
eukprot:m51a1_g2658 putative bifunctional dihydrofolate reductase-thymidylate synthase (511) ;mRNA; r:639655-641657